MKKPNPSGIAFGLLAISLALASCAATEPARTPAPAPATVQATAAAASAAKPEFPGFTLTVRKGEELYCQKRNPTGSRARVIEACFTRDQMLKMAQNNEEYFKQAGAQGSHDSLALDSPR